jgi:hypothetical protein
MVSVNPQLKTIIDQLSALLNDCDEKAMIDISDNTKDSVVIGTETAIAALALRLLQSVVDAEPEVYNGLAIRSSDGIYGAVDGYYMGFDWLIVTESQCQTDSLYERVYRDCHYV